MTRVEGLVVHVSMSARCRLSPHPGFPCSRESITTSPAPLGRCLRFLCGANIQVKRNQPRQPRQARVGGEGGWLIATVVHKGLCEATTSAKLAVGGVGMALNMPQRLPRLRPPFAGCHAHAYSSEHRKAGGAPSDVGQMPTSSYPASPCSREYA